MSHTGLLSQPGKFAPTLSGSGDLGIWGIQGHVEGSAMNHALEGSGSLAGYGIFERLRDQAEAASKPGRRQVTGLSDFQFPSFRMS